MLVLSFFFLSLILSLIVIVLRVERAFRWRDTGVFLVVKNLKMSYRVNVAFVFDIY